MAVTEVNKPPVNLSTNPNPCSHPLQIRRVLYGRVYAECVVCSHMTPDNRPIAGLRYRPIAGVVYALVALFLLAFIPAAHASGYVMNPAMQLVDNTNNCAATASLNCWTSLPGTVTQASIGNDGAVYAQNSAHTIYRLPPSTNTTAANWVQSTLPPVMQIAVQNGSSIYGLSQHGSCAAPTWGVYKANAALNGWVAVSPLGCASSIAVSMDGVLGVVAPWNGGVAYFLKPGGSWTLLPGTGYTGQMAVQNIHTAYVQKGTTVYQVNLDNNTVSQITVFTASSISVDANGVLWYVGLGNTRDNGNLYSYAKGLITSYRGFLDKVATGGLDFTFGIQAATGNIYHFRHSIPMVTLSMDGSYNCAAMFPATGQCPAGSQHTATVTIAFNDNPNAITATRTGTPATQMNIGASDVGRSCDLIFGDPNSPTCKLRLGAATVFCSIMGQIFSQYGTQPFLQWKNELAWTWAKKISMVSGSCTGLGGWETCLYNVTPWCDAAHTPPDFVTYLAREEPVPSVNAWGWLGFAFCNSFKTSFMADWSPWQCTVGGSVPVYETQNPQWCTKNNPAIVP